MEVTFTIEYKKIVQTNHIPQLPANIKNTIKKAIEIRLTKDPIRFGKPLQYSKKGSRRLRVGDYRIVYIIDHQQKIVIITAIKHRKEVYL